MNTFSIKEAYSVAWETFKKNLRFILLLLLLIIGISVAVSFVTSIIASQFEDNQLLIFAFSLPLYLLQYVLTLGQTKIVLDIVDNKKPEFSDLFSQYPKLISYMVASIIFGILLVLGLILLIIPGIIVALMFQFYMYVIVDKNVGPIEALKISKKITQGNRWKLFLYALSTIGAMILGVLALVVGLFIAIPVVMIATTYIYRKLDSTSPTAQPVIAQSAPNPAQPAPKLEATPEPSTKS